MTLDVLTEALYQSFVTSWAASAYASAPIMRENEIFQPPGDLGPWVRMSVGELDSRQRTSGVAPNRKWRRDCAVFVQCFAPTEGSFAGMATNGGAKKAMQMAEVCRRAFEGRTISTAKFRAASVSTARPDPDSEGRWILRLVTAPFFFIEIA